MKEAFKDISLDPSLMKERLNKNSCDRNLSAFHLWKGLENNPCRMKRAKQDISLP